ncbi:cytochrome P450 [Artemisia annua]|uniref:Cytochrome P450 n=1 Tax=Artemisia annua TaxID=35608 RepID=A0A2U1L9R1_ARTAN|nr:cytochrome P450 [Artemisia annua]
MLLVPYLKDLMPTDERPPVVGPIFYQFINSKELYDYMASLAKKYPTFRFVTPTHSEVYTADPVNVEYILKTNFANYTKGEYINNIMRDMIGSGISRWMERNGTINGSLQELSLQQKLYGILVKTS